ncbi:tetratricopeptide repeat protein [Candidatus Tisiphia endosymbiont of Ptychoptera albimana]|uniref:tetratricopeptide repeat protein n=1 Tax=Candidatus Tisiphia endosymbiont of Ptychoptera albimana TaxID=3066260 RepID=UPI001DE8C546|nr:tetratricopeptide repeat protein [Rickettsia endosymbiont of Sericostoma sp. HW-2014]
MKMINIKQLIIFIGLVLITLSGCANRNKIVTNSLDGCVHSEKGYNLAEEGKLEEAIKEYDLAIKYQPENPVNYYNKAIALAGLNKWQEAIKEYDLAIKYQPNNADAYNNKGIVLEKLGKWQDAIINYDLAIKHQPEIVSHSNKARVLIRLGKWQESIKECDLAIKYNPDNAKLNAILYCAKGSILLLSHKLLEAITEFDKAIKYDPNYASSYKLKDIALTELDRQKAKIKEAFDKSELLRVGESLKTKNN